MIDFIAWQGKTLADHRALTLKSIAEGYRFVSLSIHGDVGAPVYAAVMDKQNPAPNPTVSSALFAVNPLKPDWQPFCSRAVEDGERTGFLQRRQLSVGHTDLAHDARRGVTGDR